MRRKRYTEAQRRSIVAAAKRERLTATQVQERFGVIPVTWYLWRRRYGMRRTHHLTLINHTIKQLTRVLANLKRIEATR